MSEIIGIFLKKFSLKYIILGAHFSLLTSLKPPVIEAIYFLKLCQIFVGLEVVRSSILYQKTISAVFTSRV